MLLSAFETASFLFLLIMTPERRAKLLAVLNKRQNDITVVLENVSDPHNVSAVMRSCDAVGMQEVYVLNTKIPRHKKWGKRSSSSAAKWLTIHQFENAEDCFAALRKKYSTILTTYLSGDAVSLHALDFTKTIALVFGNEHDGVSEEIRKLADGNFVIPQTGIICSLNISVACAVTLYEAYRQKSIAGHYNQRKLDDVMFNSLLERWEITDKDNIQ
jgi:tRNA (guanosine-2'-O-)-methyltransferase